MGASGKLWLGSLGYLSISGGLRLFLCGTPGKNQKEDDTISG